MTPATTNRDDQFLVVDDMGGIGFGWIAPTPKFMQRTSHAISIDGRVWFTDPVYDRAMLDRACTLGAPAGVIQQLDRHPRDCARVAAELGIPHLVMPVTAPAGTPFEVIPVIERSVPRWHEIALWFPSVRVLCVAEAIGGAPYFCVPGQPVGPHPLLRPVAPPRVLSGVPAEHVICGHGPGVHGPDAGSVLTRAIQESRRASPRWILGLAGVGRR